MGCHRSISSLVFKLPELVKAAANWYYSLYILQLRMALPNLAVDVQRLHFRSFAGQG